MEYLSRGDHCLGEGVDVNVRPVSGGFQVNPWASFPRRGSNTPHRQLPTPTRPIAGGTAIPTCKTVESEPKTDSDQAEGCRNNLSFWRGWKGNVKYLITLWKAKISVPPYLPLSTGLTDPDSPQSEQILTYIYKSDSINKFRSYNLSLSMCGPQGDYTRLFL